MSMLGDFRRHRENDDTMVILQHRTRLHERFFCLIDKSTHIESLEYTNDGKLTYQILGYAKDTADAQMYLYGKVYK